MFKIEFEEHVGKKKTAVGVVPVKLNQQRIFCTNTEDEEAGRILVGYVGNAPQSPINLVVNLGADINAKLIEAIKEARKDLTGNEGTESTVVPTSDEEEESLKESDPPDEEFDDSELEPV